MTLVTSSRDVLAKALRPHMRGSATLSGETVECDCGERFPSKGDGGAAQALHAVAQLPVVDVSALADDEALLRRIAGSNWTTAKIWLRALAAALEGGDDQ